MNNHIDKTWTTKDGRLIPYSKLTDEHLINIIKMFEAIPNIKKSLKIIHMAYGPEPRGEGAYDAWSSEFDRLMESKNTNLYTDMCALTLQGLYDERKKRL